MIRRPRGSTRTDPPFPYPTLVRSGYTRVMTTAIALETSKGDLPLALALGLLLLFVVLLLNVLAALVRRWRERRDAGLSGLFGRSEEHTSELQSLMRISYAVFFLKKKNNT